MPLGIKRQTAYKIWISQINNSKYVKREGFESNYIELGDKSISRVNIIATVVGKYISEDKNYAVITLDDSTDTIRVKGFGPDVKKIEKVDFGDLINIVGKIKEYNDERYLTPEIIVKVKNKNWLIVRALEIKKFIKNLTKKEPEFQTASSFEEEQEDEEIKSIKIEKKEVKEETKIDEDKKQEEESMSEKMISIIKELDSGKGASLKTIIEKSGLDEESAKTIIFNLLKSGDLFEPTKNMLKVLD